MEPPRHGDSSGSRLESRYLLVLPVLFYEFLALALIRGLLPTLMLDFWGKWTYTVIGVIDTGKGLLAFVACPMFGRLSDVIGRKKCLFVTVLGTASPVIALCISNNLWIFAGAAAFSGCFAATFPLVFSYIGDLVPPQRRAPAYGLALATFGLSFSLGPAMGAYIAEHHGNEAVFLCSVLLIGIDLVFIAVYLPESLGAGEELVFEGPGGEEAGGGLRKELQRSRTASYGGGDALGAFQWNPLASLKAFSGNPLLKTTAKITLLYYTSVWAVVSTLMVYVARQFQFGPVKIGQLLSAFGVCTMFAEGVLVRWMVPKLGEKLTLQIGLLGFAAQCVLLGLAHSEWMVFASMGGSLLSNLVYPSISSLISRSVATSKQGEVLGAINGVRALTEGFGPLLFSCLFWYTEDTFLPGCPYLIAAVVCLAALLLSYELPDAIDDDDSGLLLGTFGKDLPEGGEGAEEMVALLASDGDSSDDSGGREEGGDGAPRWGGAESKRQEL
ncbi:unnamed protein product [Ectocarpus sp. 4 AP-2014]